MMPASAAFSIFLSPLAALLVLAPALSAASCLHGTTLVPRSEHGAAGAAPAPTFGYSGAHGPLHWHTLQAPAYNKCARGRHQSPINIEPNATTITALHDAEKRPRLHYPHVPSAQLHNLGTTLQTPVNGSLAFGGATWALKQFHFHTPSEHRLEEEYFPVEVHFVHERTNPPPEPGRPLPVLVFGVFTDLGAPRSAADAAAAEPLRRVLSRAPDVATRGAACAVGPLDFGGLAAHAARHVVYQYAGSLTTPPCAEGVTWLVSGAPLPLDVRSFNALKRVLRFNARYTQSAPGEQNALEKVAESLR